MLVKRRTKLEEELAIERRKFCDKPDCINKKIAQDIEWGIKLTQSEIDYHISQVGSNCDHVKQHNPNSWEHKCSECNNYTLTDFGSPNGSRDYEWMEKRVVEIGDLIFKLEDEIFTFEKECECKKYDYHKQLKAKALKEQILMLDNERRELKEKINHRTDFIPYDDKKERDRKEFVEELNKALSERDGQKTWEQEESAQESNGDYSLTTILGRKYGGNCSDCGVKGELIMTKYVECNICKERIEGDGNWRCEKCNDKKYKHSCTLLKKQKNKNENEENKNNSPQNTININISNNSNEVNSDNNENKKLEQIIQEIETLKQKIAQLEKTGVNPQKVQELKHQVQNLEAQKQAQLSQQTTKSVEKNQETNKQETITNPVPTKNENHKTILLIGSGLLIACAVVIGYLLGKLKSKDDNKK
ncbi:hypothetical protein [endosymbiont GvMRE of Glomus versiforme]|uniref:hypothetical protein n=1 Tax=endosymbiont GvMRE of Glomus versiforme TaxID=2039283 RepID=UPI000EB8F8FC|nr:hypothetical protein [endosymbiont GvMRE of Glomus versiforme]RHZ37562.1 hypothetical protein GvMRE_I1g150 [endosymbiont GvMRE of Glomus versiforme]